MVKEWEKYLLYVFKTDKSITICRCIWLKNIKKLLEEESRRVRKKGCLREKVQE